MESNKNSSLIFAGKCIPRERVVYFSTQERITFPYIDWKKPTAYHLTIRFPFYRKWLYSDSIINWKTKHGIFLKLDTGEILREWYYDEGPSGYSSWTNCESAMANFIRNYYK